jgi:hypothetical protein
MTDKQRLGIKLRDLLGIVPPITAGNGLLRRRQPVQEKNQHEMLVNCGKAGNRRPR